MTIPDELVERFRKHDLALDAFEKRLLAVEGEAKFLRHDFATLRTVSRFLMKELDEAEAKAKKGKAP